ncbi:hypothetical protein ACHAWF_017417 [Thalassiosira exigua]
MVGRAPLTCTMTSPQHQHGAAPSPSPKAKRRISSAPAAIAAACCAMAGSMRAPGTTAVGVVGAFSPPSPPRSPPPASASALSTSGLFRPRPSASAARSTTSRLGFALRDLFEDPTRRRRRRLGPGPSGRLGTRMASEASADDDSISGAAIAANGDANGEDEFTSLRSENKLLRERLKLLQDRNDELLADQRKAAEEKRKNVPYEQRLIIEDFEGEGIPEVDARGGVVDGWSRDERRYTEPCDDEYEGLGLSGGEYQTTVSVSIAAEEDDEDELGLADPLEDDAACEYDDATETWLSNAGECPVEPNVSFGDAFRSRAYWLVGLLALQSCSGFILSRNELLLQDHPVIIYFLTMLVGAGGNAGNQASVRVIRGLDWNRAARRFPIPALGTLNPQTQTRFLSRELRMAFALSAVLSIAGFLRATIFQTPFPETLAITLALSMIVFSSICLGAVLPLLLQKAGVDPAHSSTTIQVVMDILGVVLTVLVSTMVLDSPWGKVLVKAFGTMGL